MQALVQHLCQQLRECAAFAQQETSDLNTIARCSGAFGARFLDMRRRPTRLPSTITSALIYVMAANTSR